MWKYEVNLFDFCLVYLYANRLMEDPHRNLFMLDEGTLVCSPQEKRKKYHFAEELWISSRVDRKRLPMNEYQTHLEQKNM